MANLLNKLMERVERQLLPLWQGLREGLLEWGPTRQRASKRRGGAQAQRRQALGVGRMNDNLQELERETGPLPEEFRRWLLERTGPDLQGWACDVFAHRRDHRRVFRFVLRLVLQLQADSPRSLLQHWRRSRSYLGAGYLPFAYDRFQNSLLLEIERGRVWCYSPQRLPPVDGQQALAPNRQPQPTARHTGRPAAPNPYPLQNQPPALADSFSAYYPVAESFQEFRQTLYPWNALH